ncbi:MAG: M48 family metalloprotease [Pseudomonadota bacterium]
MFRAYGLYSHIRANRIRSGILLACFVLLLLALLFSFALVLEALPGGTFAEILERAAARFARIWYWGILGAGVWFAIANTFHRQFTNFATGAVPIGRSDAPDLYNALEDLCISRGITTPQLQIIETSALNAFASGLRDRDMTVSVTRGLLDALTPDELEAVLAHELTHIRNYDTHLMVIAIIFAGIFAFFGDLIVRRWDFPYGWSPAGQRRRDGDVGLGPGDGPAGPWPSAGRGYPSKRNNGGGNGAGAIGALIAIAIAIAIVLVTWGVSILIRLALSRSREYLADAGAVELTKNPDALIRALRKIERNATFDVPSRMEAFFIENPVADRVTGLLSTHPSIDDRVDALIRFAHGREDMLPADNAAPEESTLNPEDAGSAETAQTSKTEAREARGLDKLEQLEDKLGLPQGIVDRIRGEKS